MNWKVYDHRNLAAVGYIPQMISANDKRPLREQIDQNYAHGGGWQPMKGWKFDPDALTISYPGDPVYRPIASCIVNGETIIIYPYAWVLIMNNETKGFEVARMD